jgi:hypothetical protein
LLDAIAEVAKSHLRIESCSHQERADGATVH